MQFLGPKTLEKVENFSNTGADGKNSLDGITHDCNLSLTNQMTVTVFLFKDFSTKSLTYGA